LGAYLSDQTLRKIQSILWIMGVDRAVSEGLKSTIVQINEI